MELVQAVEVGPRCPVMPEPVALATDGNEQVLVATLAYLYFGLTYRLSLRIPILEPSILDLPQARLTITIQDTNNRIE